MVRGETPAARGRSIVKFIRTLLGLVKKRLTKLNRSFKLRLFFFSFSSLPEDEPVLDLVMPGLEPYLSPEQVV